MKPVYIRSELRYKSLMEWKWQTGAIIGRFQPFHNGHLFLLQEMLKFCQSIKIGIGSILNYHTAENPFTFEERREMILLSLQDCYVNINRIKIEGIPDLFMMDKWVQSIFQILGPFDIFFTNNPQMRQVLSSKGIE